MLSLFKTDAGLELNVAKTSILPKGVTDQAVFDIAQTIMQATASLAHLRNDFLVDSFCPEGFIGIGVPIGDIIDDVEKLDAIQDGFIHFQLTRFCQATRLQYLNSHMVGMRLARTGRTWSFICRTLRGVLVCLLTVLLKMLHFIVLLPVSWPGLVLSLYADTPR